MPISAMPEHLNSKEEIEAAFPDDSQYGTATWWGRLYKKFNKETKTWFAFSYRCTEWWAKWRKYPKILFAVGGNGLWRFENEGGEVVDGGKDYLKFVGNGVLYLSRIQYYKRWHFAIQWPLMISFHFYPKADDVPKYGAPRPNLKGKVWFGYWNHYDADNIYWMFTSLFFGNTWK